MPCNQPTPIQNNVFAVSVSVNSAGDGLIFNPDPVKLTKTPNALIVYSLTSPGYYFPTDGSALVINCPEASAEFPIAWYINAATLALTDQNDDAENYKYTMTVVNADNGKRISTDPDIRNDGDK